MGPCPHVRRNLQKSKAAETVRARCRAGDSPVLSWGLDWAQTVNFGDSGVQHTKPCLGGRDCDVFGETSTSPLVRDKLKVPNPCEQQSEFQPCQTDSAALNGETNVQGHVRPWERQSNYSNPADQASLWLGRAAMLFSSSLPGRAVPWELLLQFLLFLPAVWSSSLDPTC